jgi:hypothetical protein
METGSLLTIVARCESRLQPNVDTRGRQLEVWGDLVLQYTKHHRLDTLDVTEMAASPLFYNKDIQRACVWRLAKPTEAVHSHVHTHTGRLSKEAIVTVIDSLHKQG